MEKLSLSKNVILPKKPAIKAPFGTPMKVMTNFYQLTRPETQKFIYLYSVSIKPEIPPDDRIKKIKIMKQVLAFLKEKDKMLPCVYMDSIIFSSRKLTIDNIMGFKTKENEVYDIKIMPNKAVDIADLSNDNEETRKILHVLTAESKDSMRKLHYIQVSRGSTFYDQTSSGKFKDLWEIYRGFNVPCRIVENGFALEIALKTRLVCRETVLHKINEFDKTNGNYEKNVWNEIVGRSVRANYGNFRYWRIHDIKFDMNPKSEFEWEKVGKKVTFAEYYKTQYKLIIHDFEQPLLVNIDKKTKKVTYIIPELTSLTGFSEQEIRKYRFDLRELTYYDNDARMKKSTELATKLSNQNTLLGTKVEKLPMIIDSILLRTPDIIIGNKQLAKMTEPERTFIINNPIFEPKSFEERNWLFIYEQDDQEIVDNMYYFMKESAKKYGIKMNDPQFMPFDGYNWKKEIQDIFENVKNRKIKAEFSVNLIPSYMKSFEAAECYNFIKRLAYKVMPLSNQVVTQRIMGKNKHKAIENLVLNMNVKKGGAVWIARMFKLETTLIMGIDISSAKIKGENKSFLGVCTSLNNICSSFYSQATQILPEMPLVECLKKSLREALMQFFKLYGTDEIPKNLIIYRDGVSESQFQALIDEEVNPIAKYIALLNTDFAVPSDKWNLKIIYVIVNKRVNARLFEFRPNPTFDIRQTELPGEPNFKNLLSAPSGTLVTSGITSRGYDFYIISQKATQGSAIPTHYSVIYDSSSLEPEKLHYLTYKLCFLDYNHMGGIRVPAPCQYARKISKMAAEHVGDTPSSELSQFLYFL